MFLRECERKPQPRQTDGWTARSAHLCGKHVYSCDHGVRTFGSNETERGTTSFACCARAGAVRRLKLAASQPAVHPLIPAASATSGALVICSLGAAAAPAAPARPLCAHVSISNSGFRAVPFAGVAANDASSYQAAPPRQDEVQLAAAHSPRWTVAAPFLHRRRVQSYTVDATRIGILRGFLCGIPRGFLCGIRTLVGFLCGIRIVGY